MSFEQRTDTGISLVKKNKKLSCYVTCYEPSMSRDVMAFFTYFANIMVAYIQLYAYTLTYCLKMKCMPK